MKRLKKCLIFSLLCISLCGCSNANAPGEISVSEANSQGASQSSENLENSGNSISSTSSKSAIATQSTENLSSARESSSEKTNESSAPSDLFAASVKSAEISADNKLINAARPFTVDNENGKLTANIGYDNYVDIKTLQNCFVNIEAENGEYSFGGAVNADGSLDLIGGATLELTDKNGLTRSYAFEVNRTVCDIPIVNLYLADGSDVSTIDRDVYSDMAFYIDSSGAEGFESTDFLSGGIHGRGHSTWQWQKKPYRLKLSEKASLLGFPKNKDYILLANYSDKSLIRNITAYDMGRQLDSFVWTPTQYSVDLFVNGEYRGVYALGEQREIAKAKINLYESATEPDRGYLLETYGADDESLVNGKDFFTVNSGSAVNLTFVDPEGGEMTDEQRKFIIDYFNAADDAIVNGKDYEQYIDTDSFADWIIMQELTCNLDCCYRRSCYFTKDKGGKIKMGPIWDFDLAFGNFSMDPGYDDWFTIGEDNEDAYITVNWCNYLMNDEKFRGKIRERWFEVRGRLVQTCDESVDKNAALLERSQAENYKVWDTMGYKVGYESWQCANLNTYSANTEFIKNFVHTRAAWIDEHI